MAACSVVASYTDADDLDELACGEAVHTHCGDRSGAAGFRGTGDDVGVHRNNGLVHGRIGGTESRGTARIERRGCLSVRVQRFWLRLGYGSQRGIVEGDRQPENLRQID